MAAPGTQILLPLAASLNPPGRAAIWSPTYAEHRRAAALAGHAVSECADLDQLAAADLAVVVNPNNPDGRLHERATLLDLAAHLDRKGGLLVVDEAFCDTEPQLSVAGRAGLPGMVVLRSFGKFFGLAGLRLGFAIGPRELVGRLRARLGPWAVSGPALEIGIGREDARILAATATGGSVVFDRTTAYILAAVAAAGPGNGARMMARRLAAEGRSISAGGRTVADEAGLADLLRPRVAAFEANDLPRLRRLGAVA